MYLLKQSQKLKQKSKLSLYEVTKGAKDQAITTLEQVRLKRKVLKEKTKFKLEIFGFGNSKTKYQIPFLSFKKKKLSEGKFRAQKGNKRFRGENKS